MANIAPNFCGICEKIEVRERGKHTHIDARTHR